MCASAHAQCVLTLRTNFPFCALKKNGKNFINHLLQIKKSTFLALLKKSTFVAQPTFAQLSTLALHLHF
jgi:hypothetical protein